MLRVWAGLPPQTTGGDARKYEAAYKNGDTKTLAGFYSDDVDYIDQGAQEVLKFQAKINDGQASSFLRVPAPAPARSKKSVDQPGRCVKYDREVAVVLEAGSSTAVAQFVDLEACTRQGSNLQPL